MVAAFAPQGAQLPRPAEPDAAALGSLAARRTLPLLAAALHVPALRAAAAERDGGGFPAAGQSAALLQARRPSLCLDPAAMDSGKAP